MVLVTVPRMTYPHMENLSTVCHYKRLYPCHENKNNLFERWLSLLGLDIIDKFLLSVTTRSLENIKSSKMCENKSN
ncbi:hypothetical protein CEXT_81531 [Caerostris extrusa]|uniref:Uncharacterized protein n=1 Tax=Caerostris extrusa TaxID=172846 RepID=A0AAV4TQT6_CAEEX|nr:hypothetical protein CEXT_81531 [Caerostris extrusa]